MQEMNGNPQLRLPTVDDDDDEEEEVEESDIDEDEEDEMYEELDTMIVACPHCSEFDRFIGKKSLVLHCRELHNTENEAEHDVIPGEGALR